MLKYEIIERIVKGSDLVKRRFKYKKVYQDNVIYHAEVDDRVIQILEEARIERTRLRVYYGDILTGEDWDEIYGVTGYIGMSTGEEPIPLLVYNSRSYGGGALLDDAIVKIET